MLSWGHSSKLSGHAGVRKSLGLIARHYWWPFLPRDVKNFVAVCPIYTRNKATHQKTVGLLQPLPIPETPWTPIAMDFITDLPPSCTVIWVAVDSPRWPISSRFAHCRSTSNSLSCTSFVCTVCLCILYPVVESNSLPFWRALRTLLQVKLNYSSAYHPQSNGQVGLVNQVLGNYLRHFVVLG